MKVVYSKDFLKQASKLPNKLQQALDDILNILRRDPFYPTLHTKHLKGELRSMLSFRITREWRVIFMFAAEDTIRLLKIGNRKDIYK